MNKQCFKCHEAKPISEFYRHAAMADGHLGKCKTCTKRDVAERVEQLVNNPEWMSQERARCRIKQERYRQLGVAVPASKEARDAWEIRNPHKRKAEIAANNAMRSGKLLRKTVCELCGVIPSRIHKHHADYSKPLSVTWLCPKCHGKQHRK